MSKRTTSAIFRADSIVRDAEFIREVLSRGALEPARPEFRRLCSLTYLSLFPRSLHEVYLTGGVAPIGRSADEVYRATYQRVADKNRAFFTRFPMPRPGQPAGQPLAPLRCAPAQRPAPDGGAVAAAGGWIWGPAWRLSRHFTTCWKTPSSANASTPPSSIRCRPMQPFNTNPVFAILHELIYCEGVPATGRPSG